MRQLWGIFFFFNTFLGCQKDIIISTETTKPPASIQLGWKKIIFLRASKESKWWYPSESLTWRNIQSDLGGGLSPDLLSPTWPHHRLGQSRICYANLRWFSSPYPTLLHPNCPLSDSTWFHFGSWLVLYYELWPRATVRRRHKEEKNFYLDFHTHPLHAPNTNGVGAGRDTLVSFILGFRKSSPFVERSHDLHTPKIYLETKCWKQAKVQPTLNHPGTDWFSSLAHPPFFLHLFLWTFQHPLAEGRQMNEETQLTCMFNDISTLDKKLCWGLVLDLL